MYVHTYNVITMYVKCTHNCTYNVLTMYLWCTYNVPTMYSRRTYNVPLLGVERVIGCQPSARLVAVVRQVCDWYPSDLLEASLLSAVPDQLDSTGHLKQNQIKGFTTAFTVLPLVILARWRPPIAAICTRTDTWKQSRGKERFLGLYSKLLRDNIPSIFFSLYAWPQRSWSSLRVNITLFNPDSNSCESIYYNKHLYI